MSPLDALAPDQRAVVQLVLQQGRSYADLAGLLGIDEAAVRRRAYRGLEALAGAHSLPEEDLEELADFLLGQQTVSEREGTRRFLADSATARAWARAVAQGLEPVAGGALPAIPDGPGAAVAAPEPEAAGPAEPAGSPAHASPGAAAEVARDWLEDDREEELFASPGGGVAAADRAEEVPAAAPALPAPPTGRAPRSSRLGGALLIAALALIIAAVVVLLVNRGSDDEQPATDEPAATQTTGEEGEPQVLAQINMRGTRGSKALGVAQVYLQGETPGFQLVAQDVPANRRNEAYGVWLYSGPRKATRLGFTPVVRRNGNLRVGNNLPPDFTEYDELVISRETSENARRPGPIVLRGPIPDPGG